MDTISVRERRDNGGEVEQLVHDAYVRGAPKKLALLLR